MPEDKFHPSDQHHRQDLLASLLDTEIQKIVDATAELAKDKRVAIMNQALAQSNQVLAERKVKEGQQLLIFTSCALLFLVVLALLVLSGQALIVLGLFGISTLVTLITLPAIESYHRHYTNMGGGL